VPECAFVVLERAAAARVIGARRNTMLKHILLPTVSALAFAGVAFSPQPAAATWINAPAATTQAGQSDIPGVVDVRHRRGHHPRYVHRGWGIPFAAAPFIAPTYGYYYFGPHKRRCGYAWSPYYQRQIWTCW
jgi:hypothetical protein